jgi:hypothetical protein
MTAAAGVRSGADRAGPADEAAAGGRRRAVAWWAGVAVAAAIAFAVLTWPLAARPTGLWNLAGNRTSVGQAAFTWRDGALAGGDQLQNVFIDSVVIDNARELREPYLDLREGAAGPAPLRTTSLNLPWTPVVALLWPLVGLVPAYNATLLLSTVATALAAFALLRRHTRWPLLAAAGALVYALCPHRMYQLSVHFNAVMWWAFPAAALAWEVVVERWRAGRPWGRPALGLAAVVGLVGLSGEYHLALYMAGLLSFLVAWTLGAAALARGRGDRGGGMPLAPAAAAMGSVAVAGGYVLVAFAYVFAGSVGGGNGAWSQVELFGLHSVGMLLTKDFGQSGEGMVYLGLPVLLLAGGGLAAVLAGREPDRLPWAAILLPLALLTLGPAISIGGFEPYRLVFEHLPLLSLQRVPQRLMVVTAMVLVLLAVVGADRLGGLAIVSLRSRSRRLPWRRARPVGAALAVVLAVAVLADYRVSANRVDPSQAGNGVIAALKATGDAAGPILGLPVNGQTTNWNSPSTYVGALARRRVLNAYNQTPAPWLGERLGRLAPLNRGLADPDAMAVLAETGTSQVVVIDEPHVYQPGGAALVAEALVASGRFRLVAADGPLILLERTG